jgi:hypothetical protein
MGMKRVIVSTCRNLSRDGMNLNYVIHYRFQRQTFYYQLHNGRFC